MYYSTSRISSRGLLYILFGIGLFFFVAGEFLFRISLVLFSFSLINNGLRLCGLPPLQFILQLFLNFFRF